MKKYIIAVCSVFFLFAACSGNKEKCCSSEEKQESTQELKNGYIQHTVQFSLKWDEGSVEAEKFLKDGKRILSALPTVQNFEALRQVSAKNNYKYYFTMVFADQAAYDAYNVHPDHMKFVEERWKSEVTDFLEADYITLD